MQDYALESRISVPGMVAEIRVTDWKHDDEIELKSKGYAISAQLPGFDHHERTMWHLPDSKRAFQATVFGLLPPDFPIHVYRKKGKVRSIHCGIESRYFEELTGLGQWQSDQLIALLRNRGTFFGVILDRLTREIENPGFASAELVSSLRDCLLVEIGRVLRTDEPQQGNGKLLDWQLRKVREMIHDSPSRTCLSVESLAAVCGISGRHLTRGFKAATGVTIHSYVEQVRLEMTKRLLEQDDALLKVVASEMGFSSASHMSLAFRKLTGTSPSDYRSAYRAARHAAAPSGVCRPADDGIADVRPVAARL